MTRPNDTTTTLNAPQVAGGDVMDETLVTQATTGAQAKRPRVVVGDDLGNLVSALVLVDGAYCLPTYDARHEDTQNQIIALLTKINAKLAKLAGVLP